MVESFSADFLPAIKGYWAKAHLELFIFLRLNSGAQGEYLTSLFPWIAAWLLVTGIWPVYLADELILSVL